MISWRPARREFAIGDSILQRNGAEAPGEAHLNIGGEFARPTAALDIETATVPRTMIVAVLSVLRLSLWTMRPRPLCRQAPLRDRQRSGQPKHCAAAAQCPRYWSLHLRQHGRFDTIIPGGLYDDPPNSWNDLVTPKM
jgi:hypothetical protein